MNSIEFCALLLSSTDECNRTVSAGDIWIHEPVHALQKTYLFLLLIEVVNNDTNEEIEGEE